MGESSSPPSPGMADSLRCTGTLAPQIKDQSCHSHFQCCPRSAYTRTSQDQATAQLSLTNSEPHLWHQTGRGLGRGAGAACSPDYQTSLGQRWCSFCPHQTLSALFFPGKSNLKQNKTCFLTNRTQTGANKYLMGKQSFEPLKVCFLRDRTKCHLQLSRACVGHRYPLFL